MNLSGPDIPQIQCRPPDGCCGPSPSVITREDFICQIRTLLPEGDVWNNTLPTEAPEAGTMAIGAAAVGCMRVGCEQLVFGSCCVEIAIPCDVDPVAPQLALVDAFAAVAYQAVVALVAMLRELDPCTAQTTVKRWGERYGLVGDPCARQWSDRAISALICVMLQIKRNVVNYDYLRQLAGRFGAEITIREAGDMNCGPTGWWTMARDREANCPQPVACPPDAYRMMIPIMRMESSCATLPLSLNIITAPGDIVFPDNCNLPPLNKTMTHDPELYEAFKWLLPKILPQPAFYCFYERNLADCIQ